MPSLVSRRITGAFTACALLTLASAAHAETLTLECQEDLFKAGKPAGMDTQTIVAVLDGKPSIDVKAHYGTIQLPATIRKREGATSITASGSGKAIMPAKKDVDACLAKSPNAVEGGEMNVWVAQTCRLQAARTPEAVAVEVSIDITVIEDTVVASIELGYAGDDEAADERYAMPSRPNCTVKTSK